MFTNDETINLAMKLASAEKEQEVDQVLEDFDLLDDDLWRPFEQIKWACLSFLEYHHER